MKIYYTGYIMILVLVFNFIRCGSGEQKLKYRIKSGKFMSTLSETGELNAVNSRVITIPYIGWKYGWRCKVVGLKDHGASVTTGDSIAQIDTQNVLKYLKEKENNLEIEKAALNKLLVEHQSRRKGLHAELATAEATLNLNKIQLKKHQFASDRKRKIKELEFKRAEVEYDKTKIKYELTQEIMENELIIQKIKLVQLKNEINDSKQALIKLKIISPQNGILQLLKNRRTKQTIRVGDELWQGAQLVAVPDLTEMEVKATVNETDIGKIYLNQSVVVTLDAFPKISFNGNITKIGKLSYKKDKDDLSKVFDITIVLETSDTILKPGMTVRCDIIVSELDDVFYVENDCIYRDNQTYYLMMSKRNKPKRFDIQIGPRNNQYTVIYGNFEKKQRVMPVGGLDEDWRGEAVSY